MEDKIFRTKTGYCHVLPDKIVLTRNGILGDAAEVVSGNITRTLIIYGIITVYFAYKGVNMFLKGDNIWGVLYFLVVIFNIYSIVNSLNNSATPVIERSKIKKIVFNDAKLGLTRSVFEVLFENKNGKVKKRLIMLPGSLSNGNEETKKALCIMKEEGLLKD